MEYASSSTDGGLRIAIWSLSKPMSVNELPSSSKAPLSSLRRDSQRHKSVHKWDAAVQNFGLRISGSLNALRGKKTANKQ